MLRSPGLIDSEDGRHNVPPLTTIRQSVYDMGFQAGYMLLAKLRKETVPETVIVSPALVIRQSCGCSNQGLQNAGFQYETDLSSGLGLSALRKLTCDSMTQVVPQHLIEMYAIWADELFTAFSEDMKNKSTVNSSRNWRTLFRMGLRFRAPDDLWHDILSVMRRVVLQNLEAGPNIQKKRKCSGNRRAW